VQRTTGLGTSSLLKFSKWEPDKKQRDFALIIDKKTLSLAVAMGLLLLLAQMNWNSFDFVYTNSSYLGPEITVLNGAGEVIEKDESLCKNIRRPNEGREVYIKYRSRNFQAKRFWCNHSPNPLSSWSCAKASPLKNAGHSGQHFPVEAHAGGILIYKDLKKGDHSLQILAEGEPLGQTNSGLKVTKKTEVRFRVEDCEFASRASNI
jgi:hypothetical protein